MMKTMQVSYIYKVEYKFAYLIIHICGSLYYIVQYNINHINSAKKFGRTSEKMHHVDRLIFLFNFK